MIIATRRGLGRMLGVVLAGALCASSANAAVLLNETWADGDRTSTTGLPYDSATWIGQSAGNGSNSVSPGSLNYVVPTNSLKMWEYWTEDGTAPDGAQPHNSVTTLAVGDRLVASATFQLPIGASTGTTSRNFRFGIFHDPTDARVQADVNSDGGGGTAPWTDALGYNVQIPIHSSSSGANPLQVGKRTASDSSLMGTTGAYTFAPNGGAAYSIAAATPYTIQLVLDVISPSQLDVTANLLQGATVLSTRTVSDTGTAFGGTANVGSLPGSTGIYTNFDQLFFRNSSQVAFNIAGATPLTGDTVNLQFTNFYVEKIVPEPASLSLLALGGLTMLRRTRRA